MSTFLMSDDYTEGNTIAIVPVKSFNVLKKITIANTIIYPPKTLDEDQIRGWHYDFNFEDIKSDFYNSTLLTFPIENVHVNILGMCSPNQKHGLIKEVLGASEDIMNVFRYISSNFDRASNLPQRAGYINGVTSGFLLYNTIAKKSDYIYGKYYVTSNSVTQGLTINEDYQNIDINKYFMPYIKRDNEAGSIIMQAFRMYSDILYTQSSTNKFMQAMSLIEYLANPFEYEHMQKVKTKIIPFSADSKACYFKLCERFKDLTSRVDENGNQVGLRTCIVHNGKNIEQLIDQSYKIDLLLRELQMYISNFINFAIEYSNKNWDFIKQKIDKKCEEVQKIKNGYDGKFEADTAVIIDIDFLNKAIEEVYCLYPRYRDRKFDITKFLLLLLKQSDIERTGYQIPIQFIYSNNVELFNSKQALKISEYEGMGFDSPFGEISIYTFNTENEHNLLLQKLMNGYLQERNYYVDKGATFTNIVFVSDRNNVPDAIFQHAEASCKKVILGRLDNKRTTYYDACTWFDVELLIMSCLDIEIYEECEDNFIFRVEDGKYQGA